VPAIRVMKKEKNNKSVGGQVLSRMHFHSSEHRKQVLVEQSLVFLTSE